jgi:hypothetical protein
MFEFDRKNQQAPTILESYGEVVSKAAKSSGGTAASAGTKRKTPVAKKGGAAKKPSSTKPRAAPSKTTKPPIARSKKGGASPSPSNKPNKYPYFQRNALVAEESRGPIVSPLRIPGTAIEGYQSKMAKSWGVITAGEEEADDEGEGDDDDDDNELMAFVPTFGARASQSY